jgi:Uncharacterized conserved protein (DUF2190)
MAWGNFVYDSGFDVTAAITKFRCVKMTAAETVGAVAAITDVPIGVAQYGVATAEVAKGKQASVRVIGVSEAEAAGAIAVGVQCTLEADGRVSALVGASGKRIVGICVGHPATTAGDRISLLFLAGGGLA